MHMVVASIFNQEANTYDIGIEVDSIVVHKVMYLFRCEVHGRFESMREIQAFVAKPTLRITTSSHPMVGFGRCTAVEIVVDHV